MDWIITLTLYSTSIAPPQGDEKWQSRYDTAARFRGREFGCVCKGLLLSELFD